MNNETASVIGGTATYTTTYTATTPASTTGVKITPVVTGLTALNYTFKAVAGTVSITSSGTISGNLTVCVGSTTQLTGPGTPATINPWVSSNKKVATVCSTGLVTGVCSGTSVITYTNKTGTSLKVTVTVNPSPAIGGALSICVGASTRLTGSGTAASSNPWISANTKIAEISSKGLVTGIAAGTSMITFTNSSGCCKTVLVTVSAVPTISGNLAVCQGSTTQLTGSGTSSSCNQWVSYKTAVATVSSKGLVKGVAAGTSLITYTNSGGCKSTVTVTVYPLPSVSAIGGIKAVCAGYTTTLTNSTSGGTWSSSSSAIAKVSANGVVTGVSAGCATISYKVTNGNGCTNCCWATVTVSAPPAQPGKFTKSATTFKPGNTNMAYSVPFISGVTYIWNYSGKGVTIKGTTNTVLVSFSLSATPGILSVTAANGCGTSIARTIAITQLKNAIIPDNSEQGNVNAPELETAIPDLKSELTVYPNPTSGSATFVFQLDENARAMVDIFSVSGQHIVTIFNSELEAGKIHNLLFDQSLPSGIYPCTLRWNGKMITVKLVVKH